MEKKVRSYRVQIINIKLRSDRNKGTDAYRNLLKKVFTNKTKVQIPGTLRFAIFRSFFEEKINDEILISGKFSKFTKLESSDWFDEITMEAEEFDIPKNKFPNLMESDYYFFPNHHRFVIVINQKVNINTVVRFLKEALNNVKEPDEMIEVNIEQDNDSFKEIFEADFLSRLEVSITYSNSDNYDETAELIDEQLKNSNINEIEVVAKPDHHGNIILKNSPILKGILEIAENNGKAKATIKDKNNKRKTIITSRHPKNFFIKATDSMNLKFGIFAQIKEMFKRNGNQ